jgi:hypothetical protein
MLKNQIHEGFFTENNTYFYTYNKINSLNLGRWYTVIFELRKLKMAI